MFRMLIASWLIVLWPFQFEFKSNNLLVAWQQGCLLFPLNTYAVFFMSIISGWRPSASVVGDCKASHIVLPLPRGRSLALCLVVLVATWASRRLVEAGERQTLSNAQMVRVKRLGFFGFRA
jgi:hypothetical protein